ncbi:protein kinase [Streptomyces sp. JV185]|uniref:serine/threonine-protein kinase n=1 Tax=Streptomyces sp. JV185 TaxID=858638 RepID=UPI002E781560|nr:protein kinase [Streptomyces sp. JV185]MEE1770448.1 protein kinase [Streptomyces sp. JV185]
MTGARIGEYVIERELGSGGMGSVYLGRSRSGRAVAIKVVRAEYAADPRFRERFRKEVEAARKVGGFHTAALVDADPDAERPWMASAYVEGPTLADEITRRGRLTEAELWKLAAELAEALKAIHSCDLVHRDLKPANIVMARDGARVLDFGIAHALEGTRLTGDGVVVGTAGYHSPEQAQGHPVTGACDVFALGAVLVAAAGGSAFGRGSAYGLMYRVVHGTADVSAVPGPLRPLVLACLRKAPGSRPTPSRLLDLCADRARRPDTAVTAVTAPVTVIDEPATEPLPLPETVTARPRAVSAPPPATYLRPRRTWFAQVVRNLLGTAVLVTAAFQSPAHHLPMAVTVVAVLAAVVLGMRLVGLLTSAKEGLVLGESGIGVGPGNDLVVLRWDAIRSVDLTVGAKESSLSVRLDAAQFLPQGFQHPAWVRSRRNGVTLIRVRGLLPVGDSLLLPDAVRAFTARHGVPLTTTRADGAADGR